MGVQNEALTMPLVMPVGSLPAQSSYTATDLKVNVHGFKHTIPASLSAATWFFVSAGVAPLVLS